MAQAALREEIVPEFQHLLGKVAAQLERMERREKSLVARSELLKGRMEGATAPPLKVPANPHTHAHLNASSAVRANADKMRQLRAKKERLQYTIERLGLEKSQKVSLCRRWALIDWMANFFLFFFFPLQNRQLRMSMSYKGVI